MSHDVRGHIRLSGVSFAYAVDRPTLDHVTVEVTPGTVLALVGRSGSGKSTLLKLINRVLLPSSGEVAVDGRDTRDWDPIRLRRHIGYVLQDVGLFPHMTVGENVSLLPALESWTDARVEARARELLQLVGLPYDEWAARWPRDLSGGQRQRIGVARALALDPPILLMDEPFGALDPVTRVELRREFLRIQQALGTTVVIVTHDMIEACALATHIGVLHDGRLLVCDTPAAVRVSSDERVQVFL